MNVAESRSGKRYRTLRCYPPDRKDSGVTRESRHHGQDGRNFVPQSDGQHAGPDQFVAQAGEAGSEEDHI